MREAIEAAWSPFGELGGFAGTPELGLLLPSGRGYYLVTLLRR